MEAQKKWDELIWNELFEWDKLIGEVLWKTCEKLQKDIDEMMKKPSYYERKISKMAKVLENDPDDLDEVEPDEAEDDNDEAEDSDTPAKKRGRPKGSGVKSKTTAFHGIVLTKRGVPKRIIVTHVMGKNVRAVSASNPDMDPVRLQINNVRHFDEDIYNTLVSRGEKIVGAIDQNFGLFNQLKPLNAPKRIGVKSSDPADDL